MVLENMTILPEDLADRVHTLITIFEAIGGLIIAYLAFSLFNSIQNRKKRNELRRIRKSIESIDKKLDKIIKR